MTQPRPVGAAPRAALSIALLALGACSALLEPADDGLVPESELAFLHVSPTAPPLDAEEVSFWIKRGETREVQLRYVYQLSDGGVSYAKCLRLVVPAGAPLRYPDGREFQEGDSARVTVRVTNAAVFRFEFDPSGLQFDPAHPAQLEVKYSYAADDANGDGVVDEADERLLEGFAFWHQRLPGEGWSEQATTRTEEALEARAAITGFSQYALASN